MAAAPLLRPGQQRISVNHCSYNHINNPDSHLPFPPTDRFGTLMANRVQKAACKTPLLSATVQEAAVSFPGQFFQVQRRTLLVQSGSVNSRSQILEAPGRRYPSSEKLSNSHLAMKPGNVCSHTEAQSLLILHLGVHSL